MPSNFLKGDIYYRMKIPGCPGPYYPQLSKGFSLYGDNLHKYFNYKTVYQSRRMRPLYGLLWSFKLFQTYRPRSRSHYTTVESVLGFTNITNFAANTNPSDADINNSWRLCEALPPGYAQITTYTYKPLDGLPARRIQRA